MNISTTVLNPPLYNAICDVFTHVEIANHGEPYICLLYTSDAADE